MTNYNKVEWYKYNGCLMPNTLPHVDIVISKQEADKLLSETGAYLLRYTSQFDSDTCTDFWYVLNDKRFVLNDFSSKMRNQIKKGIRAFYVKKVNSLEIANKAYSVYEKAMLYYGCKNIINETDFYKNISRMSDNIENDFWGVYSLTNDKIVGYAHCVVKESTCGYNVVKLDPLYIKEYSGYALFYTVNDYYLNKLGVKYVHNGTRSISHDTNIQDFLVNKFMFRKAYCKLNVVYSWKVKFLVCILYFFRKLIYNKFSYKYFNKINVLIKQEEIRRACNCLLN